MQDPMIVRIYIYIYTHSCVRVYIYIYRERERERDRKQLRDGRQQLYLPFVAPFTSRAALSYTYVR